MEGLVGMVTATAATTQSCMCMGSRVGTWPRAAQALGCQAGTTTRATTTTTTTTKTRGGMRLVSMRMRGMGAMIRSGRTSTPWLRRLLRQRGCTWTHQVCFCVDSVDGSVNCGGVAACVFWWPIQVQSVTPTFLMTSLSCPAAALLPCLGREPRAARHRHAAALTHRITPGSRV